jgi:hypothetical protein
VFLGFILAFFSLILVINKNPELIDKISCSKNNNNQDQENIRHLSPFHRCLQLKSVHDPLKQSFNEEHFDFEQQRWTFPFTEYKERIKILKLDQIDVIREKELYRVRSLPPGKYWFSSVPDFSDYDFESQTLQFPYHLYREKAKQKLESKSMFE